MRYWGRALSLGIFIALFPIPIGFDSLEIGVGQSASGDLKSASEKDQPTLNELRAMQKHMHSLTPKFQFNMAATFHQFAGIQYNAETGLSPYVEFPKNFPIALRVNNICLQQSRTQSAFLRKLKQRWNPHPNLETQYYQWLLPSSKSAKAIAKLIEKEDCVHQAESDLLLHSSAADQNLQATATNEQIANAALAPNDPLYSSQTHLQHIAFPAAYPTMQSISSRALIAIVDSGIDYNHPDLRGRIHADSYDFADEDSDAQDVYFHGTSVAGIAAATTNNNEGVTGAYGLNSQILAVKVFTNGDRFIPKLHAKMAGKDVKNLAYSSWTANGIEFAARKGADAINVSILIEPYISKAVENAIQSAVNQGSVVVISGGNENRRYGYSFGTKINDNPVNGVLTVGASVNYRLVDRSNHGPAAMEIAAPGAQILTTRLGGGYTGQNSWGTSYAAPLVTAAAAMIAAARRSVGKRITPPEIEQIIINGSTKVPELTRWVRDGRHLNLLGIVEQLDLYKDANTIALSSTDQEDLTDIDFRGATSFGDRPMLDTFLPAGLGLAAGAALFLGADTLGNKVDDFLTSAEEKQTVADIFDLDSQVGDFEPSIAGTMDDQGAISRDMEADAENAAIDRTGDGSPNASALGSDAGGNDREDSIGNADNSYALTNRAPDQNFELDESMMDDKYLHRAARKQMHAAKNLNSTNAGLQSASKATTKIAESTNRLGKVSKVARTLGHAAAAANISTAIVNYRASSINLPDKTFETAADVGKISGLASIGIAATEMVTAHMVKQRQKQMEQVAQNITGLAKAGQMNRSDYEAAKGAMKRMNEAHSLMRKARHQAITSGAIHAATGVAAAAMAEKSKRRQEELNSLYAPEEDPNGERVPYTTPLQSPLANRN